MAIAAHERGLLAGGVFERTSPPNRVIVIVKCHNTAARVLQNTEVSHPGTSGAMVDGWY